MAPSLFDNWSRYASPASAMRQSYPPVVMDILRRASAEHSDRPPYCYGVIDVESWLRMPNNSEVQLHLVCRGCSYVGLYSVSDEVLLRADSWTSNRVEFDFERQQQLIEQMIRASGPPIALRDFVDPDYSTSAPPAKRELPVVEPPRRAVPSDDGA